MHTAHYNRLATRTLRVQSWDNFDQAWLYDQTDTVHNFQTLDPLNPMLTENDLDRAYRLARGDSTSYLVSKGMGGCNVHVSLTRI